MFLPCSTAFSSSHCLQEKGCCLKQGTEGPSQLCFAILITRIPSIPKCSQFSKQAVVIGVSVCFHRLVLLPGANLSFLLCPANSSSFSALSVQLSPPPSLILQRREVTPPLCAHRSLCTYIGFLQSP